MTDHAPTFPPLIKGVAVAPEEDPSDVACRLADAGEAEAGEIFWSSSEQRLDTALVVEPEVSGKEALEAMFVAMVAFGDCVGALAPPEVGVMYRWPNAILVNGARAGAASVGLPDQVDPDIVPDWMIVGLRVDISPADGMPEPGLYLDRTTLWDEGCGEVTRTQLLESYSRHLKTWFHRWDVDGKRPVREAWLARSAEPGENVKFMSGGRETEGRFLGLDEEGNLLAKCGEETVTAGLAENIRPGFTENREVEAR